MTALARLLPDIQLGLLSCSDGSTKSWIKLVDRKPVIVSLTPLPLSADSRTLKQVMSVHRFGFKSIVIEGKPSRFAEAMPFEVISIGARADSRSKAPEVAQVKTDDAQAKTDEGKSDSSVLPVSTACDVQSLSILNRSSLGQLVLRAPGGRRVARALQRSLHRAVVSLRGIKQVSERPSAKDIVLAIPYAMLLLAKEIVSRFIGHTLRSVVAQPRRCAVGKHLHTGVYHLLAFARHLTAYLNQYVFQVLSVAPRADIYYLHAFYQFPAVLILCLRYRAKLIYDAHDFYSQLEDDANFSPFWKNWVVPFEGLVERLCVKFANDVVTVNDGIAALMRKRFGCKPLILRNVHDLRLDRQPTRTIREAIGLPPEAFLVVSIGNWKPGMAIDEMFKALSLLPQHVHLAFLGAGYLPLGEAINSSGIGGRVHIVKSVLPQEVVPFIAPANASIILYYGKSINYQNALPNRFFQSIAAELPLIYPDLPEIRRLADQYGIGLVADPRSPSEIASALRTLIENTEKCIAIRKNLDAASRELRWEGEEQVLRRLFHRHLGIAETSSSAVEEEAIG